jgi:hypothetical protein
MRHAYDVAIVTHRRQRRLAALTVAGVLAVGGIGLGLGLRRAGTDPPAAQPSPRAAVAPRPAAPPDSFVTLVSGGAGADGGDLAVVSAATGEPLRSLAPLPNTSPLNTVTRDRRWVYFPATTPSPGIYRVPYGGGPATKVTGSPRWPGWPSRRTGPSWPGR